MTLLREKAVLPAMAAAKAIADSEFFFFGTAEPDPARVNRLVETGAIADLLGFVLDNRTAPVDSLWIKAGALGFHEFEATFADLEPNFRTAYEVFQRVFLQVTDALEQADIHAAEAEERQRIADEQAAMEAGRSLEGTGLEQVDGPFDAAKGMNAALDAIRATPPGFSKADGARLSKKSKKSADFPSGG